MTHLILETQSTQRQFGQWFTPAWAADALIERYFPGLGPHDLVLEPSCGAGAFLQALPPEVPAIGVEIDPHFAELARRNTGREILVGDFRRIPVPFTPTVIVGNPPYEVRLIEGFLSRARHLLPDNGRCGFLLPAYAMQTHRRVWKWHQHWSISADIIPRRLFPRLRLPLLFVMFTKEEVRTMVGFALYREAVEIDALSARAKRILVDGAPRMGAWRALVQATLEKLGGRATLPELYHAIEPRRPTPNPWWQEKTRQILQRYFRQVDRGVWSLV